MNTYFFHSMLMVFGTLLTNFV